MSQEKCCSGECLASSASAEKISAGIKIEDIAVKNDIVIDLYETHKNDGDVYKMWMISKIPDSEKEADRMVSSLDKLNRAAYKIVIEDAHLPVAGGQTKAVIIGSGILATAVSLKLGISSAKTYGAYTFFSDDTGHQYCMKLNEAN